MPRKYFFFLLCVVLIVACKQKKEESFDYASTIPREKLVDVLCDVHLTEAILQDFDLVGKDSNAVFLYSKIFELHKIQEKDFYETMQQYHKNPKALKDLYEKVVQTLEERNLKLHQK